MRCPSFGDQATTLHSSLALVPPLVSQSINVYHSVLNPCHSDNATFPYDFYS